MEVSSSMYSDTDYIMLKALNMQLVNQMLPNADMKYLVSDDGLISAPNFIYTVHQLGFLDTTAYGTFQSKQDCYNVYSNCTN